MAAQGETLMDDLLSAIRDSLPWGQNPEFIDDMVGDITVLVLEGRIRRTHLAADIKRHIPALRKKYRVGDHVSLDQPIADDGLTLKDVILKAGSPRRWRCPNCRGRVTQGRTYCTRLCAISCYWKKHRKIDPAEFAELHLEQWLGRDEIAAAFGVTKYALDNMVHRHGLSRKLPDTCKIPGCDASPVRFRNCKGQLTGTLCLDHKREAQRKYSMKSRRKRNNQLTPEQRSEHARKAALVRWAKNRTK